MALGAIQGLKQTQYASVLQTYVNHSYPYVSNIFVFSYFQQKYENDFWEKCEWNVSEKHEQHL